MDRPRWPMPIMEHAFNPVCQQYPRLCSSVRLVEPQGGIVKLVFEAYVREGAKGAMRKRDPFLPSEQRGRTVTRHSRKRKDFVLGRGIHDCTLVELVGEGAL